MISDFYKSSSLPKRACRWPTKPGRPARHDYEYKRNGTANLFMMFARSKAGATSKSRTAIPRSIMLTFSRTLATRTLPTLNHRLVQDNLNIHSKASLYEAFPAAEARRLVERFERHYTPSSGL